MHKKLNRDEYNAIGKEVLLQLQILFPQADAQVLHAVLGPEILAQPLRISTLKTKVDFEEIEKQSLTYLREKLARESDKTIRAQKLQQLENIILLGQLLFSHAACVYFFKGCQRVSVPSLTTLSLKAMEQLIAQEGLAIESSRFEVLSRRKQFDELFAALVQQIKTTTHLKSAQLTDMVQLRKNLCKVKVFYYQINDLNFKYAQKPSRSFSTLVNIVQYWGSKIAITATVIAIGATALSFISPLTPIMMPIALAASYISLAVGVPLALKNLVTVLYNFFRFGAAPSTGELMGVAFIATNLLTTGLNKIASQLVTLGLTGQWVMNTANALKEVEGLTKASLGVVGQMSQLKEAKEIGRVNEYRVLFH